jgi:hypothetical protein
MQESEEVQDMVFLPRDKASMVLDPGKQPFDLQAAVWRVRVVGRIANQPFQSSRGSIRPGQLPQACTRRAKRRTGSATSHCSSVSS